MFSAEVGEGAGPCQYGVNTPGGSVACRHYVEGQLHCAPQRGLIALDVSNMHGSMCLGNIEHQVQNRVPRMWPLISRWLRVPRRHVYKDPHGELHIITAVTGVGQGCRSASFLASLGVAPVHEALREYAPVAALQDDTYLMPNPDHFTDAAENAATAFAIAGCQLNLRKCKAWSPVGAATGRSNIPSNLSPRSSSSSPCLLHPWPTPSSLP